MKRSNYFGQIIATQMIINNFLRYNLTKTYRDTRQKVMSLNKRIKCHKFVSNLLITNNDVGLLCFHWLNKHNKRRKVFVLPVPVSFCYFPKIGDIDLYVSNLSYCNFY